MDLQQARPVAEILPWQKEEEMMGGATKTKETEAAPKIDWKAAELLLAGINKSGVSAPQKLELLDKAFKALGYELPSQIAVKMLQVIPALDLSQDEQIKFFGRAGSAFMADSSEKLLSDLSGLLRDLSKTSAKNADAVAAAIREVGTAFLEKASFSKNDMQSAASRAAQFINSDMAPFGIEYGAKAEDYIGKIEKQVQTAREVRDAAKQMNINLASLNWGEASTAIAQVNMLQRNLLLAQINPYRLANPQLAYIFSQTIDQTRKELEEKKARIEDEEKHAKNEKEREELTGKKEDIAVALEYLDRIAATELTGEGLKEIKAPETKDPKINDSLSKVAFSANQVIASYKEWRQETSEESKPDDTKPTFPLGMSMLTPEAFTAQYREWEEKNPDVPKDRRAVEFAKAYVAARKEISARA